MSEYQKKYVSSSGGSGNIYNNGFYDKVGKIEYDSASSTMSAGFEGGVVPYFFNTMSQTGTKKIKNPNYNPLIFKQKILDLVKAKKIIIRSNHPAVTGNTILGVNNAVGIGGKQGQAVGDMNTYTGVQAMNEFGAFGNCQELITKSVQPPPIPPTHNNMIPYIGGSVKQNTYAENRQQDGKMEAFTGQFKLDQNHKREELTLFAPIQQDVMSTDSPRQMDRYSNSLTVRNGEIPFEKTYVGKGLNAGYSAKPSGGFHQDIEARPLPKNSEQLYVNPKVSYKNRIIKGKHMVAKRTAEQGNYKYAPETLIHNENGQWNGGAKASTVAPTARSQVVMRDTNRKCNKFIMGAARDQTGSKSIIQSLKQTVKASDKVTFLGVIMGAVQAIGKQVNTNAEKYTVRDTGRTQVNQKYSEGDHRGIAKANAQIGAIYHTDKLSQSQTGQGETYRPTEGFITGNKIEGKTYDPNQLTSVTGRQTIENNNQSGNLTGGRIEGKTYDPLELTKTTGRQTIENNNGNGNLTGGRIEGKTYDPNQLTKTTRRQTIENNNQSGNLSGGRIEGKTYDPNQLTKTTGRQTIENNNGNGNLTGGRIEGKVYDPNQLTSVTGRQTIENSNQSGNLVGNRIEGKTYNPLELTSVTGRQTIENNNNNGNLVGGRIEGKTYDPKQLTSITGRQTIENNTQSGQLKGRTAHVAYDPFDVTRTTGRQQIEDTEYTGIVSGQAIGGGSGYTTAPQDISDTHRQEYSDAQYLTGAEGMPKAQVYDSAYSMRQNTINEIIDKHRDPYKQGVKRCVGADDIFMTSHTQDVDLMNQYALVPKKFITATNRPSNNVVGDLTSCKNISREDNIYYDTDIVKQLKNNDLNIGINPMRSSQPLKINF